MYSLYDTFQLNKMDQKHNQSAESPFSTSAIDGVMSYEIVRIVSFGNTLISHQF